MLKLNIRRKLFHLIFGLIIIVLLIFGLIDRYILLILLFLGVLLSQFIHRIPVLHKILQHYERPKDLITMPGKGAVALVAGIVITLFIFPKDIALAAICVLVIGDTFSAIVGLKIGRIRYPYSQKTIEGSIAGFIVSMLACLLILTPMQAVGCAFFGMLAESFDILEDNISIPIAAGITAFFLGMF
ncbi:hypothetical protein K9M79_01260 [Candidatus Woesearchaeota archaeon]|nr:hypothetical protein [Candidatus Woesearchaeota archaeon]